MKNYWVPKHKIDLVEWLYVHYTAKYDDVVMGRLKKMNKKQLYAIYFSIRDKMERELCGQNGEAGVSCRQKK